MRNQKGEVMTAAMVVIMAVMMLFGGMHLMQGDHRATDHDKGEHQHDQQKEEMHHMHCDEAGQAKQISAIPDVVSQPMSRVRSAKDTYLTSAYNFQPEDCTAVDNSSCAVLYVKLTVMVGYELMYS